MADSKNRRAPRGTVMATGFFTRLRGLMFRGAWPREWRGLYFPRCRSVHTFFTSCAFAIVFLDADGRVTRYVAKAKPWRVYTGPPDTQDVLEVPKGAVHSVVGRHVYWKEPSLGAKRAKTPPADAS